MQDRNKRHASWRKANAERLAAIGREMFSGKPPHNKALLSSQEDYAYLLLGAGYPVKQVAEWYKVSPHVIYKTKYRKEQSNGQATQ